MPANPKTTKQWGMNTKPTTRKGLYSPWRRQSPFSPTPGPWPWGKMALNKIWVLDTPTQLQALPPHSYCKTLTLSLAENWTPPLFFFLMYFELPICYIPQRTNTAFRDPSKPCAQVWSSQSLNTDDTSFLMAEMWHLALPTATSKLKYLHTSWRCSADHHLPTKTLATYVWMCDHANFKNMF